MGVLALSLISNITSESFLNFVKPWFLHLSNKDNNKYITDFIESGREISIHLQNIYKLQHHFFVL